MSYTKTPFSYIKLRLFNNAILLILSLNYTNILFAADENSKQNSYFLSLEEEHLNNEINRIKQAFDNVDKLLKLTVIQVQKIDENYQPKEESKQLTNLWDFLTSEQNFLLTPSELIRLFDNGAVLSKSGFLIKVRTGHSFGDMHSLNEQVQKVLKKALKKGLIDSANVSLLHLLRGQFREQIIEIFEQAGLHGEDICHDAQILDEMRRHLIFFNTISYVTWFNAGKAGRKVSINRDHIIQELIIPENLSFKLIGNYYFEDRNASVSNTLSIDHLSLNYSESISFSDYGLGWSASYSQGSLGIGANYTLNFDKGVLWSKTDQGFLTFGAGLSGFKDRLSMGVSIQTLLGPSAGLGLSASVSISKNHEVNYLGKYPLDGKFASLRGLHKIEIRERSSKGAKFGIDISAIGGGVPVSSAFMVGKNFSKKRVYRTHTTLKETSQILNEKDLCSLLLIAGKKVKEIRHPQFDDPLGLIEGDELVELKTGVLSGAFVIGVQAISAVHISRIGASIDINGEFELGLRRLPNNIFELSIEPSKVVEIGLFQSLFNIMGAGQVKGLAIARKQIFQFDFNKEEARLAYFDLILQGRLPINGHIQVYLDNRSPDYLLRHFRVQNEKLQKIGVRRTYLEKIRISTKKFFAGLTIPMLPAVVDIGNKIAKKIHKKPKKCLKLRFEGLDIEILKAKAKSVATNGIVAVHRETSGGRRSKGQGFCGRYAKDIFVTHRRLCSIDKSFFSYGANKWSFDSLSIHAELSDTMITGDEENMMVNKINRLFDTHIAEFSLRNSKEPRTIDIERELSKVDLDQLLQEQTKNRISIASKASGVAEELLSDLLENLSQLNYDEQALVIKHFIESFHGFKGFAAIHQLLGALPEHLYLRSESGYMKVVDDAKEFMTIYRNANEDDDKRLVNLDADSARKDSKYIKNFFIDANQFIRSINRQIALLDDDKYFIDEENELNGFYSPEKTKKLLELGVRQGKSTIKSALISARRALISMLDLKAQGFCAKERLILYRVAKMSSLGLLEQADLLSLEQSFIKNEEISEQKLMKQAILLGNIILDLEQQISMLNNNKALLIMDNLYIEESSNKMHKISKKMSLLLNAVNEKIEELQENGGL